MLRNDKFKPCCLCKKKSMQRCSACNETYYCSQACQKEHWKIHKKDCKELQEFNRSRKSQKNLSSENFQSIHETFESLETLEAAVRECSSQSNINGLLLNSMLCGSASQVQYLIDKGADVNIEMMPSLRRSIIFTPVSTNRLDILKVIVESGANVNHADKDGMTPLIIASQQGYEMIVDYLIAKGAKVNTEDYSGSTSLMLASQHGRGNVVKKLIDSGANINQQAKSNGRSALYCSCGNNQLDVVRILVENGADLEIQNNQNHSPLCIAAITGHREITKYLLDKGANVHVFPMLLYCVC